MHDLTVRVPAETLRSLDTLVLQGLFVDRGAAVGAAVSLLATRADNGERLARECAKLDPAEERSVAEEGMVNCGNRTDR